MITTSYKKYGTIYMKPLSLQGRSQRFKSCSAHKGFSELLSENMIYILIFNKEMLTFRNMYKTNNWNWWKLHS